MTIRSAIHWLMGIPADTVFLDDGLGALAPLRDLRPVFDARLGPLTTRQRHERSLGLRTAAVIVPPELEAVTRETAGVPVNTIDTDALARDELLVVNGRCPLPLEDLRTLEPGSALHDPQGGLIAARLSPGLVASLAEGLAADPRVEQLDAEARTLDEPVLLTRPWHPRAVRDLALEVDLTLLEREPGAETPPDARRGFWCVGPTTPRIHPSARVMPGVVIDTEPGPVRLAAGAVVRPGAVITGPASIGAGSTVLDNAVIRPKTTIGPVCKVGGEIGGCVFQGYSNKAHGGYLGDSWVGAWVNLGAGTITSNLKNTYSEVRAAAEPDGPREHTGQTFLGAVIGDHVKTAIGTRLMAGTVLHTGAMWAASGPVSGAVERFAWVTDRGRERAEPDKFLASAAAVMARRDVELSAIARERLRELAS